MSDRDERLEEVKIYREAARHYFNTRSNLTYLNIVGCGAVAVLFAGSLVDSPGQCYVLVIQDRYWLYLFGLIVIAALAAWATAICNLLSNSFYSYMLMVRELEDDLRIRYPPPKPWAVTYEFLTKEAQNEIYGPALRGNVWNLANAFLAISGVYAMALFSEVAHAGFIFYVTITIYVGLIFLIAFLSMRKLWEMTLAIVVILGLTAVPFAATPTQRHDLLKMDPSQVTVPPATGSSGCYDGKEDAAASHKA